MKVNIINLKAEPIASENIEVTYMQICRREGDQLVAGGNSEAAEPT